MNKKVVLISLFILIVIGGGGYWYWFQTGTDVAQHIGSFPKEVYNSRYFYGDYSVTEDLHNNKLTFQNLKTKETKTINARAVDLVVGDGFATYITESKDEPIDQKSNTIAVFELKAYDFNTAKEEILIPKIANNGNGNGPKLDISGRKILVSGYGNNLTFYDLDTKTTENAKLSVGEQTRSPSQAENYLNITPGVYDIIPPHTFYVGNFVIFEADVFGSENAIFSYDRITQTYTKLRSAPKHIAEMYYSNGYIYWDEVEMWSSTDYYRMKIGS